MRGAGSQFSAAGDLTEEMGTSSRVGAASMRGVFADSEKTKGSGLPEVQFSAGDCIARHKTHPRSFPLPREGNTALAEDLVVKDQFSPLVGHPKTHMQWQQMLLAGVAVACGRCFLPFGQALFTL